MRIHKNAIFSKSKQFGAMASIDDQWEILHELYKGPILGPLKFKMADIRHHENRQIAISQREIIRF